MRKTHDILLETRAALPALTASSARKNAALLAIQILAVSDEDLAKKLAEEKQKMAQGVYAKDKALQEKLEML